MSLLKKLKNLSGFQSSATIEVFILVVRICTSTSIRISCKKENSSDTPLHQYAFNTHKACRREGLKPSAFIHIIQVRI